MSTTWTRDQEQDSGDKVLYCGMELGGSVIYCGQSFDGTVHYCGRTIEIWSYETEQTATEN